ncbi:MAG: DSD1 family PLP-dependent enzyme [Proteobacteria bacterium]|nr:DSD1 family PLP-dependent enzyme [Pseudomonadota bacterium]
MDSAPNLGPNEHLIGTENARLHLATPSLILDLDVFEDNLARMMEQLGAAGIALRPHGKTHKSATIAKCQIEQGALGVCCATLREAEAIAGEGVPGVLITSPVVGEAKINRLIALHDRAEGLMICADNPENVKEVSAVMTRSRKPLPVIVDFDVGMHRTGVANQDDAAALAQLIEDLPGLRYAGIQGYSGKVQHIESYADRDREYNVQMERLEAAVKHLTQNGLAPKIVTGGGTGTHALDCARGLFTEHQAGSYIFMDVEYNAVELHSNAASPFAASLFVQCSVVSNNHDGFVTIDGGYKCFATDGPKPEIAENDLTGAWYERFGDEHGQIMLPEGAEKPGLAAPIRLITPHCDPTVNLHNFYHCVRSDRLVDIWRIDGRGVL